MKPFNVFPYGSKIDFMRMRMVSLTIAALLMFAAIGAMAVNGFNFALDFTGGVGVELGSEYRHDYQRPAFGKAATIESLSRCLSASISLGGVLR